MKNNDDIMPVSKFLKILLVILLFLGLIYFITEKLVKKDETSNETATTSYNEIVAGMALSINETMYYVLAYDPNTDIANYLDSWQSSYISLDKDLKLYYIDLSKVVNKNFIAKEASNPNATKEADLQLKNGTLMVVENGKITKYTEDAGEIYNLLK